SICTRRFPSVEDLAMIAPASAVSLTPTLTLRTSGSRLSPSSRRAAETAARTEATFSVDVPAASSIVPPPATSTPPSEIGSTATITSPVSQASWSWIWKRPSCVMKRAFLGGENHGQYDHYPPQVCTILLPRPRES